MSYLLWAILRSVHCRSTHHYFAIDALPMVQTEPGKRLVGHLLRHYQRYLDGSRDPDVRFRDYQNHVIHATDGYWGGAPRVAHQWYDRMLRYLRSDRYADAAHAAGVLSHYFTDPFQPLHTQLSDRAAVLHRPFEWSILQGYDQILDCWREDEMRVVFRLSDRPQWLGEAILHGARFANRKYQTVLNEYQLAGVLNDPSRGLSVELCASMAEVFGIAITGWARVIERAGADAETTRRRELSPAWTMTGLVDAIGRIPIAWIRRRGTYKRQRMAVKALLAEYAELGRLQQCLPAEVDVVHRVVEIYHQERQQKQLRAARRAASATLHASSSPSVLIADRAVSNDDGSAGTLAFQASSDVNSSESESARRRAA